MSILTRRSFAAVAGAAAAVTALPADPESQWLTVMHVCWNENSRWYHKECMEALAARINREAIPVTDEHPEDTRGAPISSLRGFTARARMVGDELQVQCRWFGGNVPVGMMLTPAGIGKCKPTEGYPGFHVVTDFRLEYFKLDAYSSFPKATRIDAHSHTA